MFPNLEAKEFTYLENVSPFLGAIIDSCCGQSKKAPVAAVLTNYVRIVNEFFRRSRRAE